MLTSRNWFYPLFSPFHHFFFLRLHLRFTGYREEEQMSFHSSLSRTKICSSYSSYLHLLVGVLQGSILGLLLFNIYMCDLFLCDYVSSTINYVDDTTLYACEPDMDLVQSKPEKVTSTVTTLHLLKTSDYIQHINVGGINSVAASMKNYQVYLQTIN